MDKPRNFPLTTTEAAQWLGLKPCTVRSQINRGKLDAFLHLGVWHVQIRELKRYERESLSRTGNGSKHFRPKD